VTHEQIRRRYLSVMPAKVGIQQGLMLWIPTYAGMTSLVDAPP
jgi:hypothetical protein